MHRVKGGPLIAIDKSQEYGLGGIECRFSSGPADELCDNCSAALLDILLGSVTEIAAVAG